MGCLELPVKINKDIWLEHKIQISHVHKSDVRLKPFALYVKIRQKLVNACLNKNKDEQNTLDCK